MTNSKKLTFIIGGAQKAATSFLQEAVSQHPDIFLYPIESEAFESPFFESGELKNLEKILSKKKEFQLGIKRPDYLLKDNVPERIYSYNPDIRIVFVLRQPLQRLVSAIYWYMQVGIIPVMDLNDCIDCIFSGQLQRKHNEANDLLEYGLYGKGLSRFMALFPRENIFVTTDTALKASKKDVLAELCLFLQVRPIKKVLDYDRRAKASVYSPFRLRSLAFANKHFFFKKETLDSGETYLMLRKKPWWLGFYLIKLFDKSLAPFIDNKKPSVTLENKSRITDFYRSDMVLLKQLLPNLEVDWDK